MKTKVRLEAVYAPSEDVVFREIEGEIILVPLGAGIGDMEDELFTLNETGRALWGQLDGQKSLKDVVKDLYEKFKAPAGEIEKDAAGLVAELLKRRMIVEVSQDKARSPQKGRKRSIPSRSGTD
jgi:hypothetical protein